MAPSISTQCTACITTLKSIISSLANPKHRQGKVSHERVSEELDRFILWAGNIGAMHVPESPLSLESRLCDEKEILTYILELLDDINETSSEVLAIVTGGRGGEVASVGSSTSDEDDAQYEEIELTEEIGSTITRLFRVVNLIRQAAPTDLFTKALSRDRYRFNEQYDIAHVGQKYPKLATEGYSWLQKRLGRAITQRRHYLSYIRDHQEKLDAMFRGDLTPDVEKEAPQARNLITKVMGLGLDTASRPSAYFTKASTLAPGKITPQILNTEVDVESQDDARSYTTISRSVDGDLDTSTTVRIPTLDKIQKGSAKEVECPFCSRIKKFQNEKVWKQHVFSDLRSYVCTFSRCDAAYFSNANDWFRHEMQEHRIKYTCRLCSDRNFDNPRVYLAHVQRKHSASIQISHEQTILDLGRTPLEQIRAEDCPCCSEWVDRLKKREETATNSFELSDRDVYVSPTVFKRHLASHMEQLALFAIPMTSTQENDESNVGGNQSSSVISSDRSVLMFSGSRQSEGSRASEFDDDLESRAIAEAGEEAGVKGNMASGPGESTPTEKLGTADDVQKANEEGDLVNPLLRKNSNLLSVMAIMESLDPHDQEPEVIPYPKFLCLDVQETREKFHELEWEDRKRLQEGRRENPTVISKWALHTGESNVARNRYANALPYEYNRVRLKVPEGENDYINASHIILKSSKTGEIRRYIATQGPKADTVRDFWHMVCHVTDNGSLPVVIVMLTQFTEAGREKCCYYYPYKTSGIKTYTTSIDGLIQIKNLSRAEFESLGSVRTELNLSWGSVEPEQATVLERNISHYQYLAWPDFLIPEDSDRERLLRLVRQVHQESSDTTQIVHCSAGVGRTGVFIALGWLLQELDEGSLDDVPDDRDPIVEVVDNLKQQRRMMVQGTAQFEFLYEAMREEWKTRWLMRSALEKALQAKKNELQSALNATVINGGNSFKAASGA